jgi:hypothetical protein
MKSLFLVPAVLFLMASCASSSKSSSPKLQAIKNITLYKMSSTPFVGTTLSGQKIKLGGFSGLQFVEEKEGSLLFQTVTDRGPNGELNGIDRPFLLPEFSPTVVVLKANSATKELTVSAEIKLKKKDGTPLTGLPNTRDEENPTDVFGLYYSIDPHGLDIEGLVFDGEGGWWMADEYSPSLVHFNEQGMELRRLTPNNQLPRMYADRKPNRGFEGIARVENKIYGFLQSPLPKEVSKDGEFSRIAEVDLETMKTSSEYFYLFEKGNDKIGDAVALNAKNFLVIEQNGKTGPQSQKYIYRITLGESDQLVKKTLIADLKTTPFNDVEKVEGLALIDNHRLGIVYDNDFQINGKTNQATGLTPLNDSQNQLMVLEFAEGLQGESAL